MKNAYTLNDKEIGVLNYRLISPDEARNKIRAFLRRLDKLEKDTLKTKSQITYNLDKARKERLLIRYYMSIARFYLKEPSKKQIEYTKYLILKAREYLKKSKDIIDRYDNDGIK